MSIASKKRRAKLRASMRAFAGILAKGGSIVMHPDTARSIRGRLSVAGDAPTLGVRIIESAYMQRGHIAAIAPYDPPPMLSPLPPLSADLFRPMHRWQR